MYCCPLQAAIVGLLVCVKEVVKQQKIIPITLNNWAGNKSFRLKMGRIAEIVVN